MGYKVLSWHEAVVPNQDGGKAVEGVAEIHKISQHEILPVCDMCVVSVCM